MNNWYNESGKELSSEEWLESHHRAKILERKKFIKMIIKDNDETIIDLVLYWTKLLFKYVRYFIAHFSEGFLLRRNALKPS